MDSNNVSYDISNSTINNLNVTNMQGCSNSKCTSGFNNNSDPQQIQNQSKQFGMLQSPIDSFIGREEELVKLHDALNEYKRVVIYGMPGSGKTELARKYAANRRKQYFYIVWIPAETEVSLYQEFEKMALELKVPIIFNGEKRSQSCVRDEIYEELSKKKCLLIFDNAETNTLLAKYLPNTQHSDYIEILITSQYDVWSSNYNTLHLDVLPEQEAITLVNNLFKNDDYHNDHKKSLIQKLGCLPLAIQLAVAYIKQMKKANTDNAIINYIKLFKEVDEVLLDCKPAFNCDPYNKTIQNAFSLTIEKIEHPNAKLMLNISSYLEPNNIPKSIFSQIFSFSEVEHALNILNQYSLVTNCEKTINIHRLVHSVIRRDVDKSPERNNVLEMGLKCVVQDEYTESEHCSAVLKNCKDPSFITNYFHKISPETQNIMLRCLGVNGCLEALQEISDERIFKQEELGYTILCAAARRGYINLIDFYFKNRSFMKSFVPKRSLTVTICRSIYRSILYRNWNFIKRYNYAAKHEKCATLLYLAIEYNHEDIIKYLLDYGVETNYRIINNNYFPIHWIVYFGHINLLKFFIQRGFSTDLTTKNIETILHIAVQRNHEQIVKYLIENNLHVDSRDINGFLPIHTAAFYGHLCLIKLLIQLNFSTDLTAEYNKTILHLAIENNQVNVVEYLLDNKINVNARDSDGYYPIHTAAISGYLHIIKLFIDRHFDLDVRTNQNDTILHLAIQKGHIETVNYLLANGINVYARDSDGLLPIHYATNLGNLDILKLFLINKITLLETTKLKQKTMLHIAVEKNDVNIVAWLLVNNNVTNDIKDEDGFLPIHYATCYGHLNLLQLFIENKFPTDVVTKTGSTILHLAVKNKHRDIVAYFLDKRINVNANFDDKGYLPIHWAVENGNLDIVQLFIEKGYSTDVKTKTGATILHLAVERNRKDIVIDLVDKRINVNAEYDNIGFLPIHWAVVTGNLEIVQLFFERKYPFAIRTKIGSTILHLAVKNNIQTVVAYLLNKRMDTCFKYDYQGFFPIHWAAQLGNLDVIQLFIENKYPLDVRTRTGATILHLAVQNNHKDIVMYLLDKRINVFAKYDDLGFLPIHWAVVIGNLDVVQLFFRKKYPINVKTKTGATILHLAVKNNLKTIVRYLLNKQMDIYTNYDYLGFFPIHWAAMNGNLDIVQLFIEKRYPTDVKTKTGSTILHLAVKNDHIHLVKYLLDKRINFDAKYDNQGFFPIHWAVVKGNLDIIQFFIDKKYPFDVRTKTVSTILHLAVKNDIKNIVLYLLDKRINIDAKYDVRGFLPIHWAVVDGNLYLVQSFIEKNYPTDVKTKTGATILHLAVMNNHKAIVEYLLDKRINVDAEYDDRGFLPIHWAVVNDNLDVVLLFIENNYPTNVRTKTGVTILHLAVKNNHKDIVVYLLEKRINIDDVYDNQGFFPIHWAIELGYLDIVNIFIESKYPTDVRTNTGATFLHIAVERNHKDIIMYLLSKRININVEYDDRGFHPIHWAVINGNLDIVQLFFEKKYPTDVRTKTGDTILKLAVENNHENIVKYLLNKGY